MIDDDTRTTAAPKFSIACPYLVPVDHWRSDYFPDHVEAAGYCLQPANDTAEAVS